MTLNSKGKLTFNAEILDTQASQLEKPFRSINLSMARDAVINKQKIN
jgi:hypothetical protein